MGNGKLRVVLMLAVAAASLICFVRCKPQVSKLPNSGIYRQEGLQSDQTPKSRQKRGLCYDWLGCVDDGDLICEIICAKFGDKKALAKLDWFKK